MKADMNAYESSEPKIGDLVVFEAPRAALSPGMNVKELPLYVKRVVGIPNDKISFGGPVITRNGRALPKFGSSNLIGISAMPNSSGLKSFMKVGTELNVPEDHYFVVGDNGGTSSDSRFWGPIHISKIQGKVTTIE